jgi:hypothetical protein
MAAACDVLAAGRYEWQGILCALQIGESALLSFRCRVRAVMSGAAYSKCEVLKGNRLFQPSSRQQRGRILLCLQARNPAVVIADLLSQTLQGFPARRTSSVISKPPGWLPRLESEHSRAPRGIPTLAVRSNFLLHRNSFDQAASERRLRPANFHSKLCGKLGHCVLFFGVHMPLYGRLCP